MSSHLGSRAGSPWAPIMVLFPAGFEAEMNDDVLTICLGKIRNLTVYSGCVTFQTTLDVHYLAAHLKLADHICTHFSSLQISTTDRQNAQDSLTRAVETQLTLESLQQALELHNRAQQTSSPCGSYAPQIPVPYTVSEQLSRMRPLQRSSSKGCGDDEEKMDMNIKFRIRCQRVHTPKCVKHKYSSADLERHIGSLFYQTLNGLPIPVSSLSSTSSSDTSSINHNNSNNSNKSENSPNSPGSSSDPNTPVLPLWTVDLDHYQYEVYIYIYMHM